MPMGQLRTIALAALTLTACSSSIVTQGAGSGAPALRATPEQVAFLCVTPGCETTETVRFLVTGSRRVAIKRILLAGSAEADFRFTASEAPPFIVGSNAGFDVDIVHAPLGAPLPGEVELRVTYTDASPEESPDRLEPGELVIPLIRRLVGEPLLTAAPATLSFGVVPVGQTASGAVRVANEGVGNIALELSGVEAGDATVAASLPQQRILKPSFGLDLPVTFSPVRQAYLRTELVVTAQPSSVRPAVVNVEGTSLSTPSIGLEPSGDIDFGELPRGKQRTLKVEVMNRGGKPLTLQDVALTGGEGVVSAKLPGGVSTQTLAPLERVPLTLEIDGKIAGEIAATVTLSSNDPARPTLDLGITGTITEPRAHLTPAALDFGKVPVGWVVTKPVEIRNGGFGALTVKNITLVAGSSALFSVVTLPALPLVLERDQRIAVDVQFRAETGANFTGWLSVESDDPVTPFVEVPITASSGTCEASCALANATPSCTTGSCQVAACNTGWYDTDRNPASGCECKEVGPDPGGFCVGSKDLGTLRDTDAAQRQVTGNLPTAGDVDVVRLFAEDGTDFSDDFDVKIRLDSPDPAIRLCVYWHVGDHQGDCYWTNESCPASRTFSRSGSSSSDDDADVIVKVFRDPAAAPTCASYTLFISNGL